MAAILQTLKAALRGALSDGEKAERSEARALLAHLETFRVEPAAESPKPRYARHAKAAKKGARK